MTNSRRTKRPNNVKRTAATPADGEASETRSRNITARPVTQGDTVYGATPQDTEQ